MPPYTIDSTEPGGRRQVILAGVFLVLAVVALLLPEPVQTEVATGLRWTLTPFVSLQRQVVRTRERTEDADRLRAQLDSLSALLVTRTTLAEENRRLRELLTLSDRGGGGFRPATVIRPGTRGSGSTFLVDAGREEGVRENAPVIVPRGLLGMVREIRPHTAIAIDWTHPDFRASAMTGDGRIFGLVEVRRGDFREEDRLVFNGAAFQSRLEDGTLVVTSGLGGVFPRGIPLGRVDGLAEAEAGWRKSYWLRPAVEPGTATHVLVGVQAGMEDIPGNLSSLWPADSIPSRFTRRVDDLRVPVAGDSLLTPPASLGDSFRTRGSLSTEVPIGGAGAPSRGPARPGGTDTSPAQRPGAREEARFTPPVTQPIEPRPRPADTTPPSGADTSAGGAGPADTTRRRFPTPTDTVRVPPRDTTPTPPAVDGAPRR